MAKDPREETPWNYCDYRCEVCRYQPTCELYNRVEVERQILRMEGKDPDDMGVILESVAATFAEVISNLKEEAAKWGIDVEAITEEINQQQAPVREFTDDPLYRDSMELTLKLIRFTQNRRPDSTESPVLEEAWEDLAWHQTLFGAKLARALSGLEDAEWWDPEWGPPDYRLSAEVAQESLAKCQSALRVLGPSLPDAAEEIVQFLMGLAILRERAYEKFAPRM